MNSLVLFIILTLGFYDQAAAQVTYFSYDAESQGPVGSGCTTATCWSEAQSHVTRSQAVVKNGAWSLRHEIPNNTNDQTGKVIRFYGWNGLMQQTTAYFSAWYYIDQGGTFDCTNPDACSLNMMQWKSDNHKTLSLLSSDPVAGNVTAVLAFNILDGVRRVSVGVGNCGLSGGEAPLYQTVNYPPNRPGWGSNCKFTNKANPTPLPKRQWSHIEVFYKQCDPARSGNQLKLCSGEIKVWVNGTLEIDVSHAKLNTLTSYNKDSSKPNRWSNNRYQYWGIGMYGGLGTPGFPYVLYTDDAKITDFRVYPTLDKLSPLLAPKSPSNLKLSSQ